MKLGNGNEIKHLDTTGNVTRFALVLEGEETLHLTCDITDPDKVIHVASAVNPSLTMATKGRFATTAKLLEDSDGGPLGTETRVDRKSVYTYVLPRVPLLMGRLLRAA